MSRILKTLGRLDSVCRIDSKIYVKGKEKKKWLSPYFDDITDLEDYDCPSIKVLRQNSARNICCFNHPPGWKKSCALKNVHYLKDWCNGLMDANRIPTLRYDDGGVDEVDHNRSRTCVG